MKDIEEGGLTVREPTGALDSRQVSSEDFETMEIDAGRRKTSFLKKTLRKRIPFLRWFPKYKRNYFVNDAIAGITVGLMVVPQSMGFAALAGLTPEYGLYSSYISCFLYIVLGSCRQVTVGPVSLLSLLVFQTCGTDFPQCAIWMGFYSGIFQLLMACLHLGVIVSFISEPVTLGFTAGAAITTISAQLRSLFGMSGSNGSGIVSIWQKLIENSHTWRTGDTVMGITSFIALLILQRVKDLNPPTEGKHKRLWKKVFWYISVARNALIVIVTTIVAFSWSDPPFRLTGTVQSGLPPVKLPQFSLPAHDSVNGTDISDMEMLNFWETWQKYSTAPLVAAIIGILQNVAISKAFGTGQSVDATQEMLTLGITNIIGGFFSSMPTCGSFSRSAVNDASGVKSPMGGLFTGTLVLLSLGFLTPSFKYIPKASLAAVIISAVMSMIEFQALVPMWRISRWDVITCLVTFLGSVFLGMEYGIGIGVAISVAALLVQTLRPAMGPQLKVDPGTGLKYMLVKPDHGLQFPSIDHLRSQVNKVAHRNKNVKIIVIDMERWTTWDYTAITSLVALVRGMKKAKMSLIFLNCGADCSKAFEAAGLKDSTCCFDDCQLPEFFLSQSINPRNNNLQLPS